MQMLLLASVHKNQTFLSQPLQAFRRRVDGNFISLNSELDESLREVGLSE